jgi:hypothetical protein
MAAVPRYLLTNAVGGAAIGSLFAAAMLATDTLSMQSLAAASGYASAGSIFILGSAMIVTPLVLATAIGLLER